MKSIHALTQSLILGMLLLMSTACMPTSTDNISHLAASGLLEQAEYVQVPFVRQSTNYSCGLACLVSVLEYWKRPANESDLLSKTPPESTSSGYSVGELKAIAKTNKAQAFSFTGNAAFLEQQVRSGRPVIVPLKLSYNRYRYNFIHEIPLYGKFFDYVTEQFVPTYSHFVTVFAVSSHTVWVMDPMYGVKPIPRAEFSSMWEAKNNAMLLVATI